MSAPTTTPRSIVVFIVVLAALAAGAAATDVLVFGSGPLDWPWLAALFVPMVAGASFQIRFRYRDEIEALDLFEAVLTPVLFAFGGWAVIAAAFAANAVAEAIRGNQLVKGAFNAVQWAAATGAGVLVLSALRRGPRLDWDNAGALVAALAAVLVVNHLAFSTVVALAHLRPSGLVYYTAIGVLLGRLYWRSGLKASILAHAAFNGCLVVVAVVLAFGPSHTYHTAGATITAPATWHEAHSADVPTGLVLSGPSGSSMAVMTRPLPPGATFNPEAIVAAAGSLPMPNDSVIGDIHAVSYKAGSGVLITFRQGEKDGELVLLSHGRTMWLFVLDTESSSHATHDFETMVRTATLP